MSETVPSKGIWIEEESLKQIIDVLRRSKRYAEMAPTSGGKNGDAGQIEGLLAKLQAKK